VDILVVPDNTGSINQALTTLQNQLNGFATQMNSTWDYHLARSMIQNPSPINRVLVNPTYNTPYLPDGTIGSYNGIVPSDRAVTDPNSFPLLDSSLPTGAADYTYSNTYNALFNAKQDTYANFIRPDALLAII